MDPTLIWHKLAWPLLRLLFFVSLGLLVANFIESLNWTRKMAWLFRPLIRLCRLPDIVGAAFTTAFFSGVTANTMLSEAYSQEKLNKKELILANLFNSLPTYFLHLPTLFFITVPLIKGAAFIYVGLTLLAAFLRTIFILFVSRFIMGNRGRSSVTVSFPESDQSSLRGALEKTWKRFTKRIQRIVLYTVPIYTVIFFLHQWGLFDWFEAHLSQHIDTFDWLRPEAVSIVALHLAAELTAGIAAAGALLDSGHLEIRQVIIALLVGNVLSSPMRALRHQFPYYAGIFSPKLAAELIFCSQMFRVGSIIIVGLGYYFWT